MSLPNESTRLALADQDVVAIDAQPRFPVIGAELGRRFVYDDLHVYRTSIWGNTSIASRKQNAMRQVTGKRIAKEG